MDRAIPSTSYGGVGGAANESACTPPEGWAGLHVRAEGTTYSFTKKPILQKLQKSPSLLFTYKPPVLELMWVHMWQADISILHCSSKSQVTFKLLFSQKV